MMTRGLTLSFCLALWGFDASAAQTSNRGAPPNVLFCLADDWSWPHAGAYGDKVVKTPAFDRIAREGMLFTHAFSAAPSCTPSRAAILTGRFPHRLAEGANLHGFLPNRFEVYPDLLEAAGYVVGFTRKGWGPGNVQAGGRTRNPAGRQFRSFSEFLTTVPSGKPFCFWFGSQDPHRPYERGAGLRSGMKLAEVVVPPFWPDTPEVRGDILDYYFEVERFDREVGELIAALEREQKLEDTIVVVSGDNGWPFPRAKANLYDAGTRQPLAIRWGRKFKGGRKSDAFVGLMDLAPTFLEAAGLKPSPDLDGRSLLGILMGERPGGRDQIFLERERHANVRRGDLGYPARAVRTRSFLYIRNLRPERWPAGDPQMWKAVGEFGDCDSSPTKELILARRDDKEFSNFHRLGFGKRPAEELYDLASDPGQTNNVAGSPRYAHVRQALSDELNRWMKATHDPRTSGGDEFDTYPYFGNETRMPARLK